MIELMFLKVLMLIRQVHLKSVLFATISIFLQKEFTFQLFFCSGCHDRLMMCCGINNIALYNIHGADYL